MKELKDITGIVVDAAIKIHREFVPPPSFSAPSALSVGGKKKGKTTMVVRVGSMYSGDCECEYYKEGERIHIDPDALSVGYAILDDEDDDEAIDGREGELSKSFDYELHDGLLCAIVDGEFVPCENEYEFECYLRKREGEGV